MPRPSFRRRIGTSMASSLRVVVLHNGQVEGRTDISDVVNAARDIARALAEGVSTPEAMTLDTGDISTVNLPFPLIVKPTREDASVGISRTSVVHDRKQLAAQVAAVRAEFAQPVLVERYIEGRELYVSLI